MATTDTLFANVKSKLDALPLGFTQEPDINSCANDAFRELGITADAVDVNSANALFIELKILWWVLFRYRNSASVFFKYAGNSDSMAVDKTMIPKMIGSLMEDIDGQIIAWKASYKPASGLLTIPKRDSTTLS